MLGVPQGLAVNIVCYKVLAGKASVEKTMELVASIRRRLRKRFP